jgi:hypothetical protein
VLTSFVFALGQNFPGEKGSERRCAVVKQQPVLLSSKFGKQSSHIFKLKKKKDGLGPRANYTDRATAACRRSDCQLLQIEGDTWSA